MRLAHILAAATVTVATNALVRHVVVVKTLTANDGNIDELEHCFGSASYGWKTPLESQTTNATFCN